MNEGPDKIVSIVSASGWWARFENGEGELLLGSVVCWALTAEGRIRGVYIGPGADGPGQGTQQFCDASPRFIGYVQTEPSAE